MLAATTFKAGYGVIVAIGYHRLAGSPVTGICAMATPGMCIIMEAGAPPADGNTDLRVAAIFRSFCTGMQQKMRRISHIYSNRNQNDSLSSYDLKLEWLHTK
jgi:hypothetical protein